jgi:hypothetical protein
MHSAPVCGAAGGNDLEFIVARQRLMILPPEANPGRMEFSERTSV